MDPDSIAEYVRWLDRRHNRLVAAVAEHRELKRRMALPGTIDQFDLELWAALDATPDD